MRKGYLIGSVVFLVLAVICIGDTVREVITGKYGMGSGRFWAAAGAHAVLALIGAALLVKARPSTATEEEPGSGKEAES